MKALTKYFKDKDPAQNALNTLCTLVVFLIFSYVFLSLVLRPTSFDVEWQCVQFNSFKEAVEKKEMIIEKRDTISHWFEEEVYLKNIKTGAKYRLRHCFAYHKDFKYDWKETFQDLVDINGKEICWYGDDKIILNFLNKSK